MQDQTDVSALARGVMLPRGSTPLHPMTGWRSLLPSSHARTPIGLPYGSLSLAGDVRGWHVPSQSQRMGEARSLHRERGMPMTRKGGILGPTPVPLWLVVVDDVYRAFTWVRPTIHPRPVSVVVLTETSSPHGCDASR